MNASYSEILFQTFVISDSELNKIYETLKNRIGEVHISADCADNIDRKFESLDELIAYENPKSKEICSLYLTASSDDYSQSASINFSSFHWRGISIKCTGSEEHVSKCKEDILDIVAGMRLWYNSMHSEYIAPVIYSTFALLFLGWCLSFIWYLFLKFEWGSVSNPNPTTVETVGVLNSIMYAFQLVFCILSISYKKLRDYAFPPTLFAIGQGTSRFKHKEKIQWCVIIGFIISLAAGFIIAIWQVIFR